MTFDVLIVSSQAGEANAIREMLDEQTFRCVTTDAYRRAMAELCWNMYDAVICDEYLVDGSWKDIIGQVSRLPTAPAVIVIANGIEDRQREAAQALGAHDMLAKPLNATELLNAVYGACGLACIGHHAAG